MRTTISVIVETVSGATVGIEKLLALFNAYEIKASFFLSPGPGRDAGFFGRRRSSNHLLNLVDGPNAILSAGHDLGMAPWDSAEWAARAARADEQWIRSQWNLALASWQEAFGTTPTSHAATDFQVNPILFELEQGAGLGFASDTMGKSAYLPVMQKRQGECVQLPVTLTPLPVLRSSGIPDGKLHEELYARSQKILPIGQHWRIDADEDPELVEKMIVMWKGSSREFIPLSAIADNASASDIRQHTVGFDKLADTCWAAAQSLPFADQRT